MALGEVLRHVCKQRSAPFPLPATGAKLWSAWAELFRLHVCSLCGVTAGRDLGVLVQPLLQRCGLAQGFIQLAFERQQGQRSCSRVDSALMLNGPHGEKVFLTSSVTLFLQILPAFPCAPVFGSCEEPVSGSLTALCGCKLGAA